MKNLLLAFSASVLAFSASAASVSDYCGAYQCNHINEWGNPHILAMTITESKTEGKVVIKGLYSPPSIGAVEIEADIDLEAGTLTIPFTDLGYFEEGLSLYKAIWSDEKEGFAEVTDEPIVGTLDNGKITFDENDVIVFGGYSRNAEESWMYALLRKVSFVPAGNIEFVYDESEWTRIGTAQYPDLCFGYKIFDTREPVVSTVDVVRNNANPYRIALLNPYKTAEWMSVNKDRQGVGQVVIDLSDPDFVVFEPFVYCGFSYNYGGLNLGKTYVYNNEAYYSRISGMSNVDAAEYLINMGQPICTYFEDRIHCPAGSIIFATESKPTIKYAFGDIEGDIILDDDVVAALASVGVGSVEVAEDAPAEYYDFMGNKVSKPAKGGMYICRKGGRATKVAF